MVWRQLLHFHVLQVILFFAFTLSSHLSLCLAHFLCALIGLCDDLGLSILSYTDSEPTKNNGSSPGYLQEGLDYSFHGQNFSI